MERTIYNKKSRIKCICYLAAYALTTVFMVQICRFLLKFFEFETMDNYLDFWYYCIFTVVGIIMFRKELVECFKDMKKNIIDRLTLTGICLIIVFLLLVLAGILADKLNMGQSQNQEAVEEWVETTGAISLIAVIAFGPITEELVFRGCFFGMIKGTGDSKARAAIGIAVSGIVFGAMHMTAYTGKELILCSPLMLEGMVLAFLYYKTDNILCPLIIHMSMNALANG